MSTALYARRIVRAWDSFDFSGFEAELDCTLRACSASTPATELESEQRAVLESVVRQFRALGSDHDGSYRLGAGFFLLRHLQTR